MVVRNMQYKLSVVSMILVLTSSRAWQHDRLSSKLRKSPDSEFRTIMPNFEPEVPEHCQNQGICEDVPNYPHKYIDDLLRQNSTVRSLLSLMKSGYETPKGCSNDQNPIEENLCPSRIDVAHPMAGRDSNGHWHYLVAEQPLCVEICKESEDSEKSKCSNNHMTVSNGYEAKCRQKHITRRMTALDRSGTIKFINVPLIPSGCCCHIKDVKTVV